MWLAWFWRLVPIGALLAAGVLVGVRLLVRSRQTAAPVLVFFRSGNPRQSVRDALAVLLVLILLGESVAVLAAPSMLASCRAARTAGVLMLAAGFVVLMLGPAHMGASWRIGIDYRARPGLVTSGLYRLSRNPIYAGMFVWVCGFALLIPNWLMAASAMGLALGIRSQVLAEEEYLARTYGNEFFAYASRVGRFLPWFGRLARR